MCFNKRVLLGLGVVALAALAVAPRLLGTVGPLLLLAACPLSMLFMMRPVNGQGQDGRTKTQGQQDDTGLSGAHAAAPSAAGAGRDQDAQLQELQEEVNRLKAEIQVRVQARSA